MQTATLIGLGDPDARLRVYVGNQPNRPVGIGLDRIQPLHAGELDKWIACNSNHWRKIFNIYAKLCFWLWPEQSQTWQMYRDQYLLQDANRHALVFSSFSPQTTDKNSASLLCGKTYAQAVGLLQFSEDLGDGFYLNEKDRVLITPYFDYRALSNRKIVKLVNLLTEHFMWTCE